MASVKDSAPVGSLAPSPSVAPSRSLVGAAIAIGLCIFVELFVLTTRGRIGAMIDDFELELPLISVVAIGWVLPALLAALILVAIVKEFIPAFRPFVDRGNVALALIGLGCFAIYIAGVFMPLFSIIVGLS